MVGSGDGAVITSSSVVVGTVSGRGLYVGGLVGWGQYADIASSSVVAGTVSGGDDVGGLVGWGYRADISSSSVVADSVSGDSVGGLVGYGQHANISSSLVLGGFINGTSDVGGIVAYSGGYHVPDNVTNTYWLNSVRFTDARSTNPFSGKSASDLQMPTIFTGIYEYWNDAWCEPETGEFTTDSTDDLATNAYRVWDLGSSMQFPVISCFGDRLTEAAQLQKIAEILDPDGDGILSGADPVPNSDPADVDLGDIDGDGFFGTEDPDDDNDNRLDAADNCPLVPNNDQANSDSDSFGNACDVTMITTD